MICVFELGQIFNIQGQCQYRLCPKVLNRSLHELKVQVSSLDHIPDRLQPNRGLILDPHADINPRAGILNSTGKQLLLLNRLMNPIRPDALIDNKEVLERYLNLLSVNLADGRADQLGLRVALMLLEGLGVDEDLVEGYLGLLVRLLAHHEALVLEPQCGYGQALACLITD